MKKILALVLAAVMLLSTAVLAETLNGTASGFKGDVNVTVTVEDGKIVDLTITAPDDTPAIAEPAIEQLKAAILEKGTIEGVDAVTNATWTSKGVFAAIENALGIAQEEEAAAEAAAVSATGLSHGVGFEHTPRLGPGKDANGTGVYSFNEVVAYVILDSEGRIADVEVDIVEIITTNHDESNEGDNFMAGWPGQSYANDAEGDGVIEGDLLMTEEIFVAETNQWLTKREKGDDYKMTSGTWEGEMDIFESFFIGKTIDEIVAWNATHTSDRNGRPLFATSTNEQDAAKFNALTDEQKQVNDALTGATMSLTDPHGDILAAIVKACENAIPMENVTSIAKTGLGITVLPRLGPGADAQDVPCYSLNVAAAGVAYDAEGKVVGIYCDVLEILTSNHDGKHDNRFLGWPGQSYNVDENADMTVYSVQTQTEESFVAQVDSWVTKRDLGDAYKMNSGTWEQEMAAYESAMVGKTNEELVAWFEACFSDANGRSLRATSNKAGDAEKYAAMTDAQKAEIDAISAATMALNDGHGNIEGAITKAWANAKDVNITVTPDFGIKLGQVQFACHGTKCFAVVTVVMQGDVIALAYIDEFQVMDNTNTLVPNSDAMFADLAAAGKGLVSKRVNNEAYSANMAAKAGSTQPLATSYDAIQAFCIGKTIAELEAFVAGKDATTLDAVSGSTLVDNYGYLCGIIEAAKAAK